MMVSTASRPRKTKDIVYFVNVSPVIPKIIARVSQPDDMDDDDFESRCEVLAASYERSHSGSYIEMWEPGDLDVEVWRKDSRDRHWFANDLFQNMVTSMFSKLH
jgi:hypothetical protein